MEMTPEQRVLRARLAAHARWAKEADRRAATQKARDAFLDRFLDEVDPDRELPESERLKRAENARQAHMTKLALASSRARDPQPKRTRRRQTTSEVVVVDEQGREHPGSDPEPEHPVRVIKRRRRPGG